MILSNAGMLGNARRDVVARQLETSAKSNGAIYNPTAKAQVSNHEIDKQTEDNSTWFFEYRALLNSKLTTLTTSLTSAYTTDMDASMGAAGPWGTKNAMQGRTGEKPSGATTAAIDPGAARTAYSYFKTFGSLTMGAGDWSGSNSVSAPEGQTASLAYSYGGGTNKLVSGTTTFITGGEEGFLLDELKVSLIDPSQSAYKSGKATKVIVAGVTAFAEVGNQMELTLYKFFSRPENIDLLRFGLFQNIFIVGTSSLPTGSQCQGSVKLDWDQNTGTIKCTQERYAAFFHS